jgi:succinate dehydrogenase/fumarate reductase flavoprotein subunit
MTKIIKTHFTEWKKTKKNVGWFSRPEGRIVVNPEVEKYFKEGKVKHWQLMSDYMPTQIVLEIDE